MTKHIKENRDELDAELFAAPLRLVGGDRGKLDFILKNNIDYMSVAYGTIGSNYSHASSKWKHLLVITPVSLPTPLSWDKHFVGKIHDLPSWNWFAYVPSYKVSNFLIKHGAVPKDEKFKT